MMMGHIGFGSKFDLVIHAFNMPMFFFASGYFFKSNIVFNKFIGKKLKTLICPYFLVGIIHFILYAVIYKSISFSGI